MIGRNSDLSKESVVRLALILAVVLLFSFLSIGLIQKPRAYTPVSKKGANESISVLELEKRVESALHFEPKVKKEWFPPVVPSNDEQWLYDVFTPPRIYINPKTGDFEPTAYQFEKTRVQQELNILSVRRPLFRYQLAGFIENSLTDPTNAILLIEDLDAENTLKLRFENGKLIGESYRMESFVIDRNTIQSGAILREGVLTLAQRGEDEPVVLKSSGRTYVDGYYLMLQYGTEQFELRPERPVYRTSDLEVTWLLEESDYPSFHFEIFESETSTVRSFTLQSYLSLEP